MHGIRQEGGRLDCHRFSVTVRVVQVSDFAWISKGLFGVQCGREGRAGRFSAKAVGESRRKDLSLDLGQKHKVCCLKSLEWKCECVTWEETD